MDNRFSQAAPPPVVHGYGAKGKQVVERWGQISRLPTLPEAGPTMGGSRNQNGRRAPAPLSRVTMYWRSDVLSSCLRIPVWRSRPHAHWTVCFARMCSPLLFQGRGVAIGTTTTLSALVTCWDDVSSMRVQAAIMEQRGPPRRCQPGQSRSVFCFWTDAPLLHQ